MLLSHSLSHDISLLLKGLIRNIVISPRLPTIAIIIIIIISIIPCRLMKLVYIMNSGGLSINTLIRLNQSRTFVLTLIVLHLTTSFLQKGLWYRRLMLVWHYFLT